MVLVELRVQLNQIFDVDDGVLEVTHGSPVRLSALGRWPVWTVEEYYLRRCNLFELFQSQILSLQVDQLLKEIHFIFLQDLAARLPVKIMGPSDLLVEDF